MIEQQARILSVEHGLAQVSVGPQSGCSACDAGQGCGAGLFGRLLRRKPISVVLPNPGGFRAGQSVVLAVSELFYLRLVARLYALPLASGDKRQMRTARLRLGELEVGARTKGLGPSAGAQRHALLCAAQQQAWQQLICHERRHSVNKHQELSTIAGELERTDPIDCAIATAPCRVEAAAPKGATRLWKNAAAVAGDLEPGPISGEALVAYSLRGRVLRLASEPKELPGVAGGHGLGLLSYVLCPAWTRLAADQNRQDITLLTYLLTCYLTHVAHHYHIHTVP